MAVETERAKLITIVCGNELEERVASDLMRAGAKGYTVSRATGRGRHGTRRVGIDDGANVRIEAVIALSDVPKMVDVLERFHDDALMAYMQDVDVFPHGRLTPRG